MSLKGLENAIRNLNSLDRHMVPQASAWAVIPRHMPELLRSTMIQNRAP